jgi:hypothetical protein
MKALHQSDYKTGHGPALRKRNEDGMATIIFITLLAIMMILVTAEVRALFHLHREVKFLEQQQIKRLNTISTNAVTAAQSPVSPSAK